MQKGIRLLVKILFIIYIGMVLFFCFYKFSSTGLDLGKYFLGIRLDRYAHFLMFFPYPFISWLTCRYASSSQFLNKYAVAFTLVTGLIFAGATEIFQDWFFASRQGDVLDFAADSLSVLTGTFIVASLGDAAVRYIENTFIKKEYDKI